MDEKSRAIDTAHDLVDRGLFTDAKNLIDNQFEDDDPRVSSLRGYILRTVSKSLDDRTKAVRYYEIGAGRGNSYDQRELGELLDELSRTNEASEWLKKASVSGDSEASLKLYWVLTKLKQPNALDYLKIAHSQNNARATQKYAIEKMKGRFGMYNVIPGIVMYFANIPKLVKYVKGKAG
jgi:TPR repeat protein